ncbi:hypothetical protein J007_02538 [Cryptococcus neoformans]|nr:hypothetical protein J007_02538 [Cryptococcus neoformans var. grubii]
MQPASEATFAAITALWLWRLLASDINIIRLGTERHQDLLPIRGQVYHLIKLLCLCLKFLCLCLETPLFKLRSMWSMCPNLAKIAAPSNLTELKCLQLL